jgi:putative SOS response-associated peptidase YedK
MPVILPPEIEKQWLRPDIDLSVFLSPFPSESMRAEVYKEMNDVKDIEAKENLLF